MRWRWRRMRYCGNGGIRRYAPAGNLNNVSCETLRREADCRPQEPPSPRGRGTAVRRWRDNRPLGDLPQSGSIPQSAYGCQPSYASLRIGSANQIKDLERRVPLGKGPCGNRLRGSFFSPSVFLLRKNPPPSSEGGITHFLRPSLISAISVHR